MLRLPPKSVHGLVQARSNGRVTADGRPQVQRAFSLIELLVVIAIIVILAALVGPATSNVQKSFQLTKAGDLLRDNLLLARQLAVTRNAPIIASFYMATDGADTDKINRLLLSQEQSDGTLIPVSKALHLPPGFGISTDTEWSSIMTLPKKSINLPGGSSADCYQLRFRASGSLELPSSDKWFFTVYHQSASADPGANFITLALDPVTGRVFSYQP